MTYQEHEQMKRQAIELLESDESAPGAVNFCLSHVMINAELPDKLTSQVYECSEGVNDTLRDALVEMMSDEMLKSMTDELISIHAEKEILEEK